jgi:thiosulfate dehydrogenase
MPAKHSRYILLAILSLGFLAITDLSPVFAEDQQAAKRILLQKFGRVFILSLGGKLYDNLWVGTDLKAPSQRNPKLPRYVSGGAAYSWRCVACHGWDYKGSEGQRGAVLGGFTVPNLNKLANVEPAVIARKFRNAAHGFKQNPLPDLTVELLSVFISYGQYDRELYLDKNGTARGDKAKGRAIYEGACLNCHQPDGRAHIQGEHGDKSSLGWVARNRPEQAIHKIRNGVPGADMLAVRFLSDRQIIDLVSYLQSLDLPEK